MAMTRAFQARYPGSNPGRCIFIRKYIINVIHGCDYVKRKNFAVLCSLR